MHRYFSTRLSSRRITRTSVERRGLADLGAVGPSGDQSDPSFTLAWSAATRCPMQIAAYCYGHGMESHVPFPCLFGSPRRPIRKLGRQFRRAALVLSELMHSIGTAAKHLFRRIWFLSPSVGAMVGWSTGHACVIWAKPQGRQIASDSTSCEHMCGFEPYHTILDAALPKFWHH